MDKIIVKKNRYVDSVSLMSIGDKVKERGGISAAEVQMGTPANKEILEGLSFKLPNDITPNDLMIAIRADDEEKADQAVKLVEDILDHKTGADDGVIYRSLDEIDLEEDPYNYVQISLPGEYAVEEAKKALEKGLNVFIFSDNVSIEDERSLKELGREKNLFVMGPDCGVGLIDGVALAAGSIIKKGTIGIVGASGSGAQEVACIIEKCGYGVSSLIGTGGRDLYPEIGGIAMIHGMEWLDKDPETSVIVLVSKLADLKVMHRVLNVADGLSKPVVAVFLGSDSTLFEGHKARGTFSLESAALEAIHQLGEEPGKFGLTDDEIRNLAEKELSGLGVNQKYFRGLYCGGTFTEEGLIYFSQHNKGVTLYTNLENKYAKKLADPQVSCDNTILDLGAEDFTAEAPHPVFEPALRLKRFYQELEDPEVAVILLDFITGPGVHSDPITPFVDAYKAAVTEKGKKLVVISNICGSTEDPQNVVEKKKMLQEAGIIVMPSNFQSARLASAMMKCLAEK